MRQVTSVVVVSGDVEATPTFTVNAKSGGVLRLDRSSASAVSQAAGSVIGDVGAEAVALPVAGAILQMLRTTGDVVATNSPIATVSYAGFGIPVAVPPDQLYRIYTQPVEGKASVSAGPSGIDCTLVPIPQEAADYGAPSAVGAANGMSTYRPVTCLLPMDAAVVPGLPAQVGIRTAAKKLVLALPVSAVSGSAQQGRVTRVKGKDRITVSVSLGISDGAYIEIAAGLRVGDVVLSYAPGLG
jgi:hypothetical protein